MLSETVTGGVCEMSHWSIRCERMCIWAYACGDKYKVDISLYV